jgi:hypothetical protein
MSENRALRIFRPDRDEVKGGWRKLHNELYDLYSSPSIRRMIWAGHVAKAKRTAYRLLLGKQEGERPLGRPRRRWVDNMKLER